MDAIRSRGLTHIVQHTPYMMWAPLLLLAHVSLVLAEVKTYPLLHRFVPKSGDAGEYKSYGWVEIRDSGLLPAGTFESADMGSNVDGPSDDGKGWYQVALDVDGELITTSTRSVSIPYRLYGETTDDSVSFVLARAL